MEKSLVNILQTIPMLSTPGETGVQRSSDGAKKELRMRLQSLLTTGQLEKAALSEEQDGTAVPAPGSTRKVRPEAPARLAEECTTKRLPPCVQSHLTAMEDYERVAASVGGVTPRPPEMTEQERRTTTFEMEILEQILSPAFNKGEELVVEVSTFFAMMPYQKGDESEKRLKINGWCDSLEHYPLYAIKRALTWWLRFGKKEPSFSELLDDVKLFTGDNVLKRKRLLMSMMKA